MSVMQQDHREGSIMRTPVTVLAVLLGCLVLVGCQTDGITRAAESTFQPARVNEPVPAPVGPAGIEARPRDRERARRGACIPEEPCRPVNPRSHPIGEVYAGLAAVAFPAWGGSVEFGQVFSRTSLATWSIEGDATYQDLSNEKGLSTTIQKLVDEGRLGMKTKGGIFDYTDESIAELRAQRFGGLVKVRKALSD